MAKSRDAWRLNIKMQIQFHPWQPDVEEANYEIELVPYKNQLLGSYRGNFAQRLLQGKVTGMIQPHWPITVTNHFPI